MIQVIQKYCLLGVILFFISTKSEAQIIYLKVQKGTISYNGKTLSPQDNAVSIKDDDKIKGDLNSIALIRQKDKVVALSNSRVYSGSQIKVALSKVKPSKNSAYLDVLFRDKIQLESRRTGAVYRYGSERSCTFFSPIDSAIVLKKRIELHFGNNDSDLLSDILVIHESSQDTLKVKKMGKHNYKINASKPGKYTWALKTSCEIQGKQKTINFSNYFIVPDKDQKTKLLKEIKSISKALKGIHKDLSSDVIREYKIEKNIHVPANF